MLLPWPSSARPTWFARPTARAWHALPGLTVGHGSLLLVAGTGRPPASPTPQPPEVLGLIAKGLNNAAIAQRLQLVPKAVRNLASSVFAKLQVADRAQAMRRALGEGLGK